MIERKLLMRSAVIMMLSSMLAYQSYLLTNEYVKFATILNIEIKKIDKFDFPAVSICHYNNKMVAIAREMMQNIPEYIIFIGDLINSTSKPQLKKARLELKTLQLYSDYYNRNLSLSIYFRRQRIGCRIDNKRSNRDCKDFIKTVHNINDDIECNTFFSRIISDGNYTIDWKSFRDVILNSTTKYMSEFQIPHQLYKNDYMEKLFRVEKDVFIVVHPYNWLPGKDFYEIHETKSSVISGQEYNLIFSKITLIRLPNPYQTDCMEYPESTSQEQSIKDCLKDHMKKLLNCLHFDSTLVFDSTDEEYKICNTKQEKWFKYKENFTKICSNKFKTDCHQKYYDFELIKSKRKRFDEPTNTFPAVVYLYPKTTDEMIYIYSPRMTTIEFIGNLGGIMSLWLGVSFISLFDFLSNSFDTFNTFFTFRTIKKKVSKVKYFHKFIKI